MKLQRLLIALDDYLSAILPYTILTSFLLVCFKAVEPVSSIGTINYSWLLALSPALIPLFIIGIINVIIFFLRKN